MSGRNPEVARTASQLNSGAVHLLRALRLADRSAGVPPAQLSALSVLVFGGPRTLGALARAEDVAGPTMTRIVDGLVASGLAERRGHPSDRRAVEIVATGAGRALMQRARERRIDALVDALGELSEADRRLLSSASPLLDAVASATRRALDGGRPG